MEARSGNGYTAEEWALINKPDSDAEQEEETKDGTRKEKDEGDILSTLGVTAVNPADIERRVIAQAEKASGLAANEEPEDLEAPPKQLKINKKLQQVEQEIEAVEAGLAGLAEKPEEVEALDKDSGIANGDGMPEGRALQKALGVDRLRSLKKQRKELKSRLAPKAYVEDDDFDAKLDAATGMVESERDRLVCLGLITPFSNVSGFEKKVAGGALRPPPRKRGARTFLDDGALDSALDGLGREQPKDSEDRKGGTSSGSEDAAKLERTVAAAKAQNEAIRLSKRRTALLEGTDVPKQEPTTRTFQRSKKNGRLKPASDEGGDGEKRKRGAKRRRPLPAPQFRVRRRRTVVDMDESGRSEDQEKGASGSDSDPPKPIKAKRKPKPQEEDPDYSNSEESDQPTTSESEQEPLADDVLLEGGLKIPGKVYNRLFEYQRTGVRWMWELHCQKAGGIIGDEMGLGKTVQVAAFLGALYNSKMYEPSMVVCPVTLLRQWRREIHAWAPPLKVSVLHDSVARPDDLPPEDNSDALETSDDSLSDYDIRNRKKRKKKSKKPKRKNSKRWDRLISGAVNNRAGILLTTYEQLRGLREKLVDIPWGYVVLDEGHRIRNPDADTTLACKQVQTVHRLIMTGAPIQNRLTELWSLFDFVFPGKLGTLPVFQTQFALPISIGGYANASALQVSTAYKCAVVLRDLITPYLLRRMKADVEAQLTKKTEQVLFCPLTEEQRQVYRSFLASREVEEIFAGSRQALFGIDILRKICNHPDLLEREERANHPEYGNPERSGKLKVVSQVLEQWRTQGHRVLLFCQTQQMLDIIENYVVNAGLVYRRMDGSTPINQRMALIDEFNNSDNVFIFILTTKVGGLGTNLTGANRVIIFDPDWNPSTDMQARERAWRIGQKRDVTVYRLITGGTIEEKVYHRQIYKQFLTNRILKDPRQRRFFKAKDMRDLFTLSDNSHGTETSEIFAEAVEVKKDPGSSRGFGKDDEAEVPAEDGENDTGILRELFEKSGVQSAMDHDAIMKANEPERVIIDYEANRVASRAAQALQQSRLARRTADVSIPTWTGRHGEAGAPSMARRRFGTTQKSRPPSVTPPEPVGGASPGGGLASGGGLSSAALLERLRQRKSAAEGAGRGEDPGALTGPPLGVGVGGGSPLRGGQTSSSEGGRSRSPVVAVKGEVSAKRPSSALGKENGGLSDEKKKGFGKVDIRNYFKGEGSKRQEDVKKGGMLSSQPEVMIRQLCTFMQENGREVPSEKVVKHFADKVEGDDVALFRQLLKQIATLRKSTCSQQSTWVLKDEYR